MQIRAVGYIGIAARNPKEWLAFATGIVGLMPARAVPGESWGMPSDSTAVPTAPASRGSGVAPDGSVYLKMDDRQWRVGVHPSPQNGGLLYLGLEVDGAVEHAACIEELRRAGVAVEMGTAAEAAARAVTGLAKFRDPAGNPLELFHGPTIDYNFRSPIANTQFVAGHLGFGHLIMFIANLRESLDFYTKLLGFQVTDYIRFGPGHSLQFLRCNGRHHSIGLADLGIPSGLHHLMFEVKSSDEVGMALDRANSAGIPITATLGRHRNDRMLSFYMKSPSGIGVEVGCEGLIVDGTWTSNEFCEGDIWGHHGIVEDVQKAPG